MGAVKHGFPGVHPNPVIRDLQVLPPPQVPAPFPSQCHSASVPYCILLPAQNQGLYGYLHRNAHSKAFLPPSLPHNSDTSYDYPLIACKETDSRQLFISMAMVMGPTPPGTGVIALHTGSTLSKSTSPHNLFCSFR